MLNEHGEEAFYGAHNSGVNHHDAFLLTLFVYTSKVEAFGHIHIELDGRDLPEAAVCILGHEVELRAVERGFAGTVNGLHVLLLRNVGQDIFCNFPAVLIAEILVRMLRIMEGEAYLLRLATKSAVEFIDDIPNLHKLLFHLRFAAETVSVVLSEGADARKTVQLACLLVA